MPPAWRFMRRSVQVGPHRIRDAHDGTQYDLDRPSKSLASPLDADYFKAVHRYTAYEYHCDDQKYCGKKRARTAGTARVWPSGVQERYGVSAVTRWRWDKTQPLPTAGCIRGWRTGRLVPCDPRSRRTRTRRLMLPHPVIPGNRFFGGIRSVLDCARALAHGTKSCSMKIKAFHRKRGFLQGFLRGLNAPVEIYRPREYVTNTDSPTLSMRSDWERIGNDFRSVMSREYGKTPSSDR